jgi:uncharacterized protein YbcV (DUF1398 family)
MLIFVILKCQAMNLQNEFQWYLDNQQTLVEKYDGKFLVIMNNTVVGVYDKEEEALFDAQRKHEAGSYIIQFCSPGEAAYTQHFHSRVVFA